MVEEKNKRKSLITSSTITILIVVMLILSGPLANALMVTLSANKETVSAGAAGEAGNITFTTWVNLSNPDAYVPIQRIYLNLSGPLPKSFSFDTAGENIAGYTPGYSDEITVVANPTNGFSSGSYYGYGSGFGYGYSSGGSYDFGYGYGYAGAGGAGSAPLNVSYTITLNTTNMYDGNYTARTNVFAASSSLATDFYSTSSVSFEIFPRIFTAPIPAIGAGNSTEPVLIQTPLGNLSYTIVAGTNASAVNLSVTVQVNPPTNVSYQINATTGGLGAGAIPSLYFNYSIDDPTWYDNISYIHVRMYYNQSAIPSNVVESTLRPARYVSNTSSPGWVKLECGTCPRTLEIVTDSDSINRSVILKASGVDTTLNYVWANVTHFSSYGVAGTVTTTTPPSSSSSGGTYTGGGGGVATSEPYDNIARWEIIENNLVSNKPVIYTFKLSEHGIYELSVTGKESENNVGMRIEALKGPTKIAGISTPPGTVYKNMNIWAGSKRIQEGLIRFKVENTWIANNKAASGDLLMVRWNGKEWTKLDTSELKKDDTYTFYETKTEGFSSFAITVLKGGVVPTATPGVTGIAGTPAKPPGTATPVPTKKTPGFEAIIAVFAIAMLATLLKNNRRRR